MTASNVVTLGFSFHLYAELSVPRDNTPIGTQEGGRTEAALYYGDT